MVQFNKDVHVAMLIGGPSCEGAEQVGLFHRLFGEVLPEQCKGLFIQLHAAKVCKTQGATSTYAPPNFAPQADMGIMRWANDAALCKG